MTLIFKDTAESNVVAVSVVAGGTQIRGILAPKIVGELFFFKKKWYTDIYIILGLRILEAPLIWSILIKTGNLITL